jgi:predicted GTPase
VNEAVAPKWVELTARICQSMKEAAQRRWGANFRVVMMRTRGIEKYEKHLKKFRQRLETLQVPYLDLSSLESLSTEKKLEDKDLFDITTGHASALHSRILAKKLYTILQKDF